MKFMVMHKPATEAGRLPDLDKVTAGAKASGALVATIGLTPSAKAKRLSWTAGKRTVVDGPFAETKELIGGYAILDMASMDECIAFCSQYARRKTSSPHPSSQTSAMTYCA